ncbi:MAG: aspartate kinase [Chloroflexi bacterium]|nr:aspartate kinase [Chloroflexota bacterium]
MRLVMKFGGTSVGDGQRIKHAAELVASSAAQGHSVVVVSSAMSGVTDALIRAVRRASEGDGQTFLATERALLDQHLAALDQAVGVAAARTSLYDQIARRLGSFAEFCRSVHVLGELTPRALDAVASLGEQLVIPILTQTLREGGQQAEPIETTQIVVTDDRFTQANPLMDATRAKARQLLLPLLDRGVIPVATGFIGATRNGVTTTLGRGGSDYSATILGSALDADEVWIWTDVNGVMTADPRVVPDARTIDEISYAEAAELSYFGAKVIHPQTIAPAAEREIPIRILNTFNPTHPGTRIVRAARGNGRKVKAITAIRQLSIITVEGRGMQGVPGVAAKVFSTVAREGINVLMISQSSSEQSICFVVEQAAAARACAALEKEFELERLRGNVDRVAAQDQVVIVAVVGAGMKGVPGISARVFGALGERELNVISIAQGSSEYNLSMVIEEKDADQAVRAIHAGFGLNTTA